MSIEVKVTITRDSNDVFRIRLYDDAACNEFVTVSMTPRDFAMALTGMTRMPAVADVHRLDTVGKRRVVERRSVLCPLKSHDRASREAWLREHCQEDGWELDANLSSQGSIASNGTLHYSVRKYVEAKK